jgi:catechol 2,3-dioxygenase-like lactoylglutathione lyase family enzyme
VNPRGPFSAISSRAADSGALRHLPRAAAVIAARFDHVGLSVADLDVQTKFYGDALGLTEVEEHLELPDAGVRTVILRAPDGLKIELIERSGSKPQEFADAFDGAGVQGYFH